MRSLLFKIKRRFYQNYFFSKPLVYWQKYGINITRNHYYSNIPDLNTLDENLFTNKSEMHGIDICEKEQIELLNSFYQKYSVEYDSWPKKPTKNSYDFFTSQTTFRSVDSQILHCMIRSLKPKLVIEVGSGYSSLITARALLVNKDKDSIQSKFIAIEPYPNEVLRNGIPGLDEILDTGVQELQISYFNELKDNDVLFFDSTHTVKIGGDVNYEILQVLPLLNKGVIVHFHDIFLPYEYPKEWIHSGERIWAEQYLLHAFLINNDSYKILWMSHFMYRNHSELLKSKMNFYEDNVPFKSSIWLKKIK